MIDSSRALPAALACLAALLAAADARAGAVMVQSCNDGDTCTLQVEGLSFRVRLLGIDAPEVGHKGGPSQPFGPEAKVALNALVAGKRLEVVQHGIDAYNRPLVTIAVGELLVNEELVRRGLAEVWEGKSSYDRKKLFLLQAEAKAAKRGMWAQGAAYVSPFLFRKKLAAGAEEIEGAGKTGPVATPPRRP